LNGFRENLSVLLFVCAIIHGCAGDSSDSTHDGDKLPPGVDMVLSDSVKFVEYKNKNKVWSVRAAEANYSTELGILKMEKVEGAFYLDDVAAYKASGKHGVYDTEKKVLDIVGDVIVTDADGYTLKTDSMRYYFEDELATTESRVEITGDGLDISGVGLEVSIKDGILNIKKEVKMKAVPGKLRNRKGGGLK